MNEIVDIWIFYAQSDKEFSDMITNKIHDDISDRTLKTSNDLGDLIPSAINIRDTDVVLLIQPSVDSNGWFSSHQADALISRTKNILIIQSRENLEIRQWLKGYISYNFTDKSKFDQTYKQLINSIKLILGGQ